MKYFLTLLYYQKIIKNVSKEVVIDKEKNINKIYLYFICHLK
jgi:hypothetical protein